MSRSWRGIGEVVGVAAVERGLLLGGEDQLDLGVLLVAVEPVLAALVERDHVGAQAGLLQALALDLGDGRLLGLQRLDRVHALLDRGQHLGGDVLHGDEHVELEVGAGELFGRGGGVEAVGHVVLLRRGDLLQLAEGHVVVGQDQAVGADEGARAAVADAHRSQADVLEPGRGGFKTVFFLQLLERHVVQRPHALVGKERTRQKHDGCGCEQENSRQPFGLGFFSLETSLRVNYWYVQSAEKFKNYGISAHFQRDAVFRWVCPGNFVDRMPF